MKLPNLTNLQFAVLAVLSESESSGRHLRQSLADRKARMSGPAFYQLMARMEEGGLVAGRYDTRSVEGQTIKERRYRLTGRGDRAYAAACEFYVSCMPGARHATA
jgi:DNA-binding PadR family transcriptional regulator